MITAGDSRNDPQGGILVLDDHEYARWMRLSRGTLSSSRRDLEGGDYNWACFKAQQSAEFAMKALLHGLGLSAYGHSISALLERLPEDLGAQKIVQEAKRLDKCYIPTRYPNAWPQGTPEDYYTEEDAKEAVGSAEDVVGWVTASWRFLKKEEG